MESSRNSLGLMVGCASRASSKRSWPPVAVITASQISGSASSPPASTEAKYETSAMREMFSTRSRLRPNQ